MPAIELEAAAHSHTLGGASSTTSGRDDTPEQRRRKVLEATMQRLRKEDEDVEQSCGTDRPGSSS